MTPQNYKTDDAWQYFFRKGDDAMQSFYMGGDVSKGYSDFVILSAQKQTVVKNFQLDDTFDGHCKLYGILDEFMKDHQEATLYAAVESTGGYEDNWYNELNKFQSTLNILVARLNPVGVSHNNQADLKRNITDKISARGIAEYLIAHPGKVTYQQHQDPMASLRKQWKFIKMLTKQSTQLLNQLESLLYTANPEILAYCKDDTPKWVLKMLLKYPTAINLARAKVTAMAKIPYVQKDRAKELVAAAKTSVASATDPTTQHLIISTVNQILHLKKNIDEQNAYMARMCSVPEVELLKTFPGIGDASAIGLMLEIQNIKRFSKAKNLTSFFGIHPAYKSSGDGTGSFKMSKKGRKEPRTILFMVVRSAITCNPVIRDLYNDHVQRGKSKMSAMGVCMHKTLRIVYGMLKHGKAFDPQIDMANRQRTGKPSEQIKKDKSRRYQNYDSKAPISRRQKKKRLEREKSHSERITKRGIITPVPLKTT
jgi:transposase